MRRAYFGVPRCDAGTDIKEISGGYCWSSALFDSYHAHFSFWAADMLKLSRPEAIEIPVILEAAAVMSATPSACAPTKERTEKS